jgi:selenocysteine lyase/cysteine desulfurase
MPKPVLAAVTQHLEMEAKAGGYEAADAARFDVDDTYSAVARLIGAQPRNIAVVENATVAFFQALSAFDFKPGDVLLTTRNDYISNQLAYISLSRRLGLHVVRAEDLPAGGVDPDSVRALLREHRPKLGP